MGGDKSLTVGGTRTESVSSNDALTVGGDRSESVGHDVSVQAAGHMDLRAILLSANGGSTCRPVARIGDLVDATSHVATGSPTVCAGP